MISAARGLWRIVKPLTGVSVRRFIAVGMLIMGLGRLGIYGVRPLASALPQAVYGLLLAGCGLAIWLTTAWRCHKAGRIAAALGWMLLVGLVGDAGVLNVTTLYELWMAYALAGEALSRHEC